MKRDDLLAKLIEELRAKYGKGSIGPGADVKSPARLPTGVRVLDEVLGGGWPQGRISEVWGPQGAGKSTLCLAAVAAAQATKKGDVVWFDQENTFEPSWAKLMGVDLARLIHAGPMAGEDAADLALQYIRAQVPLVVVDSVIEMIPEKELLRGSGEESVGTVARLLARWLPKVVVLQGKSPTVVLLVNQVRDRIGFFFGETERAPGGHTLAHLDSVRLKVHRRGWLKERDKKVGYTLAFKVVKSKVGGETREGRVDVNFEKGIVEHAGEIEEETEE